MGKTTVGSNPTASAIFYFKLGCFMAYANKDLQVGDLLETEIGEVYAYLGFFEGTPYSIYSVPSYGHMYLFCDSMHCLRYALGYDKSIANAVEQLERIWVVFPPQACELILRRNLSRLRSGFDGNARYTKSYVRFKRLVGHIDIPERAKLFQYVYNCRRLGDKKPKGYKGQLV